jgi:hypothetical protein
VEEVGGVDVFEEEAARAGTDGFIDVLVEVEGGKHEYASGEGGVVAQPACGRDSVGDWHADVHQDDIRSKRAGEFNCFVAVLGLPDDVDLVVSLEDQAETAAHERLVVGEQDADHVGSTALTV